MGSSSSRPSDVSSRSRRFLSSLVCGSSSTNSTSQREEYPDKSSAVSSVENFTHVTDESHRCRTESSPIFESDCGFNGSGTESGTSSSTSSTMPFPDKNISTGKEQLTHQSSANKESSFANDRNAAGTSYEDQNESSRDRLDEYLPFDDSENTSSTTLSQEPGDGNPVEASPTRSGSFPPDSLLSFQLFGDSGVAVGSSSGFFASDNDRDLETGLSFLVSSSILPSSVSELSHREARRDRRRLFWDALSRRTFSRRDNDSPAIVLAAGHIDDLGPHDIWFHDLSDLRDIEYLTTPRHRHERRWQLRSETLERHSRREEARRRTTMCRSGLHPESSCSCESLVMGEESSTFASISRVFMLAEALFEVLDEIHRQPLSFSLSTPASEAIVNSFPVKFHKKSNATESEPSDIEQCYICLAEYEEEDRIRVLPCHHEYHMSCVDKWLKEFHGVCPLCRCNVGECPAPVSAPNSEVPL